MNSENGRKTQLLLNLLFVPQTNTSNLYFERKRSEEAKKLFQENLPLTYSVYRKAERVRGTESSREFSRECATKTALV